MFVRCFKRWISSFSRSVASVGWWIKSVLLRMKKFVKCVGFVLKDLLVFLYEVDIVYLDLDVCLFLFVIERERFDVRKARLRFFSRCFYFCVCVFIFVLSLFVKDVCVILNVMCVLSVLLCVYCVFFLYIVWKMLCEKVLFWFCVVVVVLILDVLGLFGDDWNLFVVGFGVLGLCIVCVWLLNFFGVVVVG